MPHRSGNIRSSPAACAEPMQLLLFYPLLPTSFVNLSPSDFLIIVLVLNENFSKRQNREIQSERPKIIMKKKKVKEPMILTDTFILLMNPVHSGLVCHCFYTLSQLQRTTEDTYKTLTEQTKHNIPSTVF